MELRCSHCPAALIWERGDVPSAALVQSAEAQGWHIAFVDGHLCPVCAETK